MIRVEMEIKGNVSFRFVCPLCSAKQRVATTGLRSVTNLNHYYGYWGSRHTHADTCSTDWCVHLNDTLEDMYHQSYGDTDVDDEPFTGEQLEEIRSGIELALNKLYNDNQSTYIMEMF